MYGVCMHNYKSNFDFNVCIFQHVTEGDITGYQVCYNRTMMNVNSLTTTLTFTAPSLPDDVFTGIVFVMVTATNRYGIGPTSEPQAAVITGKITFDVEW